MRCIVILRPPAELYQLLPRAGCSVWGLLSMVESSEYQFTTLGLIGCLHVCRLGRGGQKNSQKSITRGTGKSLAISNPKP